MNPIWFLRMKRWAQHPPSRQRVYLVVGILVVCLAIYGLETAGLLPDWMKAERASTRGLR